MQESTIGRIAWWAIVITAVIIAWQAGKLTWSFRTDNDLVILSSAIKGKNTVQVKNSYQSWNLFGKQEVTKSAAVKQKPKEVKKTSLRLQLVGVVVGKVAEESGAIISEKGKTADYYKVNDALPGNARLANVYEDHVLLSRNGVLEKLSFDETVAAGKSNAIAEVERKTQTDPSSIDTPEQFMSVAQARLAKDPRSALASVGLSPASGSSGPSGYVFNGRNPMLAAMNMQKGDVIRSVNGHILGDIDQDKTKLQELYDSGVLEVEIEREGATFTISYPLR